MRSSQWERLSVNLQKQRRKLPLHASHMVIKKESLLKTTNTQWVSSWGHLKFIGAVQCYQCYQDYHLVESVYERLPKTANWRFVTNSLTQTKCWEVVYCFSLIRSRSSESQLSSVYGVLLKLLGATRFAQFQTAVTQWRRLKWSRNMVKIPQWPNVWLSFWIRKFWGPRADERYRCLGTR